ncbi:MAG TPA: glycosyl transferase family 1 [Caulobacteraceae bacterium]
MKVAYFVHDLGDAAVAKRVWMLRAAGAEVCLAGFRRTAEPPASVAGIAPLDLGRTQDARLLSRAGSVLGNLALAPMRGRFLAGADVVLARNLEVYAVAAFARALHAPRAKLAYECLDVHRLMLSQGLAGRALRGLESRLLARSGALIVSSPAFLSEYFGPFQRLSQRQGLTALVVENKAYPDAGAAPALVATRKTPQKAPWRIGWYGMVRCRRSLDFLCGLARRRPDLVQVDIRGKPSYTEFDDFDRQTAEVPGVTFGGPYRPEELPALYGALHFNWSVDYFQDEGNSRWLLPNRLYEGGRFGVPPIARTDSETGRWLQAHSLGALFERPEAELEAFLDALTPDAYAAMRARHAAAPQALFVMGPEDCERLLAAICGPEAEAGRRLAPPASTLLRA